MTVPSLNTYDSSAHLYFCDIVVDNLASPFIMEIWLKTSKTDLFRKEISVFVGCTDMNCALCLLCLRIIMATWGEHDGPLPVEEWATSYPGDVCHRN